MMNVVKLKLGNFPYLRLLGVVVFFIVLSQVGTFWYLFKVFMVQRIWNKNFVHKDDHYANKSSSALIPKHIHQVFVKIGDRKLPKRLQKAMDSWPSKLPRYKYTLWSLPMVEKLIREKYPELLSTYLSNGRWISRVDMAKYIVIHEYGGVYTDIDYECVNTYVDVKLAVGETAFIRRIEPFGFNNDIFGATPKHPFFKHILEGFYDANRWYYIPHMTVMFTAGPLFFSGRYWAYTQKENVHVLPREPNQFALHVGGGTWYGWDTIILSWIFDHFLQVLIVTVLFVSIAVALYKRVFCSPPRTHVQAKSPNNNYYYSLDKLFKKRIVSEKQLLPCDYVRES